MEGKTGEVQVAPEASVYPKLRVPYCEATWLNVQKEIPQQKDGMRLILEEIDKQAVGNFSLIKSSLFPGVEISAVKLSPTKALVEKIAGIASPSEKTEDKPNQEPALLNKAEDWFLFSAFRIPPDGNAYVSLGMGIDRFIQLTQKVARRMKDGEKIPEFNIYLIGAGTGFGEKITQEYLNTIKRGGMEARGKLNAEIVNALLPKKQDGTVDTDNKRIVFQGVSMGTASIDHMLQFLPDEVKANSQYLLDSPAGTHKPYKVWKGLQATAGLLVEGALTNFFDQTAKTLTSQRGEFVNYLQETGKTVPETKENKKLKKSLAITTGLKLIKGRPLNTSDNRYFIRERDDDILTSDPIRKAKSLLNRRNPQGTFSNEEKSFKGLVHARHFFEFEHFKRWGEIVKYCKSISQNPSSSPR